MTRWRGLFLAIPGAALLALELASLRWAEADALEGVIGGIAAQGAVYFVAVYWVVSRRPSPLWLVLAIAALLRLPLLVSDPFLSDDVYRYVWDGRVQAAGVNPYRYVPGAPELEHLRDDDIYPNINRSDYAVTIYPPAAQLFFLAATRVSESVTWMKAALLLWEGLAIALLVLLLRRAGHPESLALLYAWHPLPIWEFAGSGHVDAAAIACILAALVARRRGRNALAGVALGAAALFKLYPLALFPALWRPGDRRMPAALAGTIAVAYAPYLSVGRGVLGFLPGYLQEEGLRDGRRYFLLQVAARLGLDLGAAAYLVPAAVVLAAFAAWICLRRRPRDDFAGGALLLAIAAALALTPRNAWYFAWLLPLAAPPTATPILLLGVQVFLLYLETPATQLWIGALIYAPFLLFALYHLAHRLERPRRAATADGEGAHGGRPEPAA